MHIDRLSPPGMKIELGADVVDARSPAEPLVSHRSNCARRPGQTFPLRKRLIADLVAYPRYRSGYVAEPVGAVDNVLGREAQFYARARRYASRSARAARENGSPGTRRCGAKRTTRCSPLPKLRPARSGKGGGCRHQARPAYDIGCNTGDYSKSALEAGAGKVIGFDFDHGALEIAFKRAQLEQLDLLAVARCRPCIGAKQSEWAFQSAADALLALAFIRHIAIGRNVPLDMAVDWLVSLARRGDRISP